MAVDSFYYVYMGIYKCVLCNQPLTDAFQNTPSPAPDLLMGMVKVHLTDCPDILPFTLTRLEAVESRLIRLEQMQLARDTEAALG